MSNNEEQYRQCTLQRGNSIHVAWIPTQFAKEGKYLKLKIDGKNWEDGWKVTDVYSSANREQLDTQYSTHRRWEDVLGE